MHLIDDVNLIFALCWTVGYFLADLTDVVNTVVGCCIDLDHIHGGSCLNGFAHGTFVAGTAVYRMFAVYCLRQDLCNRSLSGTSRSAEQVCVSDTVRLDLVGQCCHNMILSFYIVKIIGTKFTVKSSITHKTLLLFATVAAEKFPRRPDDL